MLLDASPLSFDFYLWKTTHGYTIHCAISNKNYRNSGAGSNRKTTGIGMEIEDSAQFIGVSSERAKRYHLLRGDDEITEAKNETIAAFVRKLEETYWLIKARTKKEPNANEIVSVFKKGFRIKVRRLFNDVMLEYMDAQKATLNTRVTYALFAKALDKFLMAKENTTLDETYVDSFDSGFLYRFEMYLVRAKSKHGRPFKAGTIILYIDKLKAVLTQAYRLGIIDKDPGDQYICGVKEEKSKQGIDGDFWKVSKFNIERIEQNRVEAAKVQSDIQNEWNLYYKKNFHDLSRTRLIFLFQTYSGMSYIDLVDKKDLRPYIQTDLSGKKILLYNRVKTGDLAIVPVFDVLIDILEKLEYNVRPMCEYRAYHERVKALMKYYNIDFKEAGTHTGRHIFGARMLTFGFSMEAVSRMMGHATIQQTQKVYAKVDKTKIEAERTRLIEKPEDILETLKIAI